MESGTVRQLFWSNYTINGYVVKRHVKKPPVSELRRKNGPANGETANFREP